MLVRTIAMLLLIPVLAGCSVSEAPPEPLAATPEILTSWTVVARILDPSVSADRARAHERIVSVLDAHGITAHLGGSRSRSLSVYVAPDQAPRASEVVRGLVERERLEAFLPSGS